MAKHNNAKNAAQYPRILVFNTKDLGEIRMGHSDWVNNWRFNQYLAVFKKRSETMQDSDIVTTDH